MSDEKEDAGTDFEGKLARIIDQKSRKRNNNDIYERFINRVHGSEENDQAAFETLESAKNLAAFEPLSTEELQLFEDQSSEQELLLETEDATAENTTSKASNTSTLFENVSENHVLNIANDSDSISIDVNDVSSDTEAPEYIDRNNIDSSNQTESPSTIDHSESVITEISDDDSLNIPLKIEDVSESAIEEPVIDNKVIKSKKSLMMAMAIGLIVLVAIALMLVFSGVLSTSAVDSIDNSTDGNVEIDSTPAVSADPVLSTDSQTTTDGVDPVSTQPATTQQDTLDNNRQDLPAVSESVSTSEAPTSENDAAVIATEEAAITYEDFRQESQTTLYRETND
ncbi:hypothetical protein JCM18901_1077 [Psychrobacter sp. JCM 18901]|uniref:hypothetical protein n=1 Tax=Psychrobacter sp. JCM 18901 TaxID=1298609 RepID=UPI000431607A|nr:hypothetical protein [Psychrobacter sp. JCM 18901]GAF55431.1 hypothetical protein JCM18901_1077 [Psychrobacter sp. JCM 18901]